MERAKINTKQKLCIAMVAVLILSLVIAGIQYAPIKKAQDFVINTTMQEVSSEKFGGRNASRGVRLREVNNFYHRGKSTINSGMDPMYKMLFEAENAKVDLARELDYLLGNMAEGLGYGHYARGSQYLEKGTFPKFYVTNAIGIMSILAEIGMVITIVTMSKKKKEE